MIWEDGSRLYKSCGRSSSYMDGHPGLYRIDSLYRVCFLQVSILGIGLISSSVMGEFPDTRSYMTDSDIRLYKTVAETLISVPNIGR